MADYAISNVPRRVVYAASGTGPYAFTFEILSQTDIAVYKASTLLTLTTDYTVTINANGTGSVTLVTTAGTSNITIVGAKNIQRTTDFTTGGDLFANTLNDELDNQTIFIQQVAETAERGLKAPVVDPTDINMTLPAKASRVGTVLAFNATTGNPEAGPSIGSVTTVAAQSANINTVATNIASVNTVAGNTSNINTVAGVSSNVTTVASNIANVNAVGADLLEGTSEINTVAVDIANVNNVGNNISNVNTVAGISANVTSVAGNASNINTVAGNNANVTTVAGISGNVTTVAGISANVTTVAGINAAVSTVATNNANVSTVATNIAAVNTNATNIVAIQNASTNATNAATSATNAANSETAAAASAAAAAASFDAFDDIYLGAKSSNPTVDNDGNALTTGDQYFNTVSNELRVWNGSAWQAASVIGGTVNSLDVTGVASFADGTVSLPSITNSGDTNTGIFFPAADTIAFTEGGAESMRLDSSGNLGIGTASPSTYGDLAVYRSNSTNSTIAVSQANITTNFGSKFSAQWGSTEISSYGWYWTGSAFVSRVGLYSTLTFNDLSSSNAERMRINSGGFVGINTSNPAYRLQVEGLQNANDIASRNSTTGGVVRLSINDSFGQVGTIGSHPLGFATNDTLRMFINTSGDVGIGTTGPSTKLDVRSGSSANTLGLTSTDTTAYQTSAYNGNKARVLISTTNATGVTNGINFSTGGSNEVYVGTVQESGGAGAFVVQGYSGAAYGERMRLNSTSTLILGGGNVTANGTGITFPATQAASSDANTLDDYEEGTWTPTVFIGATEVTSYHFQNGIYTKVGRMVHANCWVRVNAKGAASGSVSIQGLPFTLGSSNSFYTAGTVGYQDEMLLSSAPMYAYATANTTRVNLVYASATSSTDVSQANLNNGQLMIQISYAI
jgi:hypothetical protein